MSSSGASSGSWGGIDQLVDHAREIRSALHETFVEENRCGRAQRVDMLLPGQSIGEVGALQFRLRHSEPEVRFLR